MAEARLVLTDALIDAAPRPAGAGERAQARSSNKGSQPKMPRKDKKPARKPDRRRQDHTDI